MATKRITAEQKKKILESKKLVAFVVRIDEVAYNNLRKEIFEADKDNLSPAQEFAAIVLVSFDENDEAVGEFDNGFFTAVPLDIATRSAIANMFTEQMIDNVMLLQPKGGIN